MGSVWAENVIAQCRKMGFDGPVWPVHPSKPAIGGLPAFAVARRPARDRPTPPSSASTAMPRSMWCRNFRLWAPAGRSVSQADGPRRGSRNCRTGLLPLRVEMPILGPNCYGVINYLDGALLWPDQHGGRRVEKGVALLSQSSNIVINLTMQARGAADGLCRLSRQCRADRAGGAGGRTAGGRRG